MELNKTNMYLNEGFGNPSIGFLSGKSRPMVEIGGSHYAVEQVGLKSNGEQIVLIYKAWGRPEDHAPMCACGKMYMFYSFGKGIWHVDESYMDGFKSDSTAKMMDDIVKSAINLFHDELVKVDTKYGTRYTNMAA